MTAHPGWYSESSYALPWPKNHALNLPHVNWNFNNNKTFISMTVIHCYYPLIQMNAYTLESILFALKVDFRRKVLNGPCIPGPNRVCNLNA